MEEPWALFEWLSLVTHQGSCDGTQSRTPALDRSVHQLTSSKAADEHPKTLPLRLLHKLLHNSFPEQPSPARDVLLWGDCDITQTTLHNTNIVEGSPSALHNTSWLVMDPATSARRRASFIILETSSWATRATLVIETAEKLAILFDLTASISENVQ